MASRRPIDDNHFRFFAQDLEKTIAHYEQIPDAERVVRQRNQIETLVKLETEFRKTLIKHPWGPSVYREFVRFICDERRNILAARPYFRERQTVFAAKISKALKKRQEKILYRFHFNYQFVLFVLTCRRWHENKIGGKIVALAAQIKDLRTAMIELNMPLAISRARIFWGRTPTAQLSYMDLVQIAAEGLMSGIDKFVLPHGAAFRHMVIGRMIGNLIEQYSETLIHFRPLDKKKIYRANKLASRLGEHPDWEAVVETVNKDVEPAHWTTAAEIVDLMAASSTVSCDAPVKSGNGDGDVDLEALPIDGFRAPESTHPDVRMEQAEAFSVMSSAIQQLSTVEKKLLRMRGVSL